MPKEQKEFDVKVQIWTKECILRSVDDIRYGEYYQHPLLFILIGNAIRDIKLPIKVTVRLDPFDIKCPIGFVKVVQLGKIKLSQFWKLTQGFQMFNGSLKEIKDAPGAPGFQKEFLKKFKLFLSQICKLECKEADNLEKMAQDLETKKDRFFNLKEAASDCGWRASRVGAFQALIFN